MLRDIDRFLPFKEAVEMDSFFHRTKMLAVFACGVAVFGAPLATDEYCCVERRSLKPVCTMKVQAFTEKAEMVACPVSWTPISTIVEDGTLVKKGDVITTFDTTQTAFDLSVLKRELGVVEAQLAHRLTEIENQGAQMAERLEGLADKLAVLEARQARLRSLPVADEVEISRGKYRIAKMNAEAAEVDLARAKDRLAREMISVGEMSKAERAWRESGARGRFAEQELAYAELPATSGTLKEVELEVANVQLEIDKLTNELAEHKLISEIQKVGAQTRKKRIEIRISEKQEDLDSSTVQAPIDGYVTYNRTSGDWQTEIAVGAKMWENFNFLKIPDMSTLAFRGVMRESVRKHFAVGDPALVTLRGRGDDPVQGRIASISTLSHDLAEKEEGSWSSVGREFGVKVFDVVIATDGPCPWIRPGMVGAAEATAQAAMEGPAVPLRFAKARDGTHFLAVDGIFQEATGTVVQDVLVLDDDTWTGKTVGMRGRFSGTMEDGAEGREDERFSVSGELLPVKSIDVMVRDIGRWPWPKVTWLVDEETEVKAGDVVVKLDAKETKNRIREEENRLNEAKSRRDELSKRLELSKREGTFKLATERNLLAIEQLKADRVLSGVSAQALFGAELTRELTTIRLDDVTRRLEREEGKRVASVSPVELAKQRREKRRQVLKLEEARIKEKRVLAGADPVARSAAKLALLKQEVKTSVTEKEVGHSQLRQGFEYEQAVLSFVRYEKRLAKLKKQAANHVIASPGAGMICYNKIWNSGTISKVNVGSQVGPRFNILSIPDLSQMYVSVEVPEKYFSQVSEGMSLEVQIPSLGEMVLQARLVGLDFIFENKEKKDSQVGLYSSHEPLGEVVFKVRIQVDAGERKLKPGAVAEVFFPFRQF
jgi:multidrug resistance efflux pump